MDLQMFLLSVSLLLKVCVMLILQLIIPKMEYHLVKYSISQVSNGADVDCFNLQQKKRNTENTEPMIRNSRLSITIKSRITAATLRFSISVLLLFVC